MTPSLRAKPLRCREAIGALGFAFTALIAPSGAQALVAPCHAVDGEFFPSVTRDVEVIGARVTVDLRAETADPRVGMLDAEIHLRNRTGTAQEVCLLIPDDKGATQLTWTWARGVVVASEAVKPGFDPAQAAGKLEHARHLQLPMAAGEVVVLRVERPIALTAESHDRTGLSLPTQLLRAFEGPVETAALEVVFADRPVGVRNTLSSLLLYEEPDPRARWFIRGWTPSIPFELHWWSTWAALTAIAEAEGCPSPAAVVQAAAKGPDSVTAVVTKTAAALRPVCAALPAMLHGAAIDPVLLRGFAGMQLGTYVEGGGELPIYRVNPAFESDSLSEPERLYARLVAP